MAAEMPLFKRNNRPIGVNTGGWQASLVRTKGRKWASSNRDDDKVVKPSQHNGPQVMRTENGQDVLLRRSNGSLLNLTKLAKAREADRVVQSGDSVSPQMQAALNSQLNSLQGGGQVSGIGAPAAPGAPKGTAWRAWSTVAMPANVAANYQTGKTSNSVARTIRGNIAAGSSKNHGGLRQTVNNGTSALQSGLDSSWPTCCRGSIRSDSNACSRRSKTLKRIKKQLSIL